MPSNEKQIAHPFVNEAIVDKNGLPTENFAKWLMQIKPTWENTISDYRLSIPNVTTTQRTTMAADGKIKNGDRVYDTDLDKSMAYEAGAWKTITTT